MFCKLGGEVPSGCQGNRQSWGAEKGWGALQRSGTGASALAASLERDARKGEGTWAQMEFTHRSTASSAFVSSSQFISQCFHPATSQRREQHSPSSQGCCEDKFVNTPEARKQENVHLMKDVMKNQNVSGTRTTPASPHGKESKGSPLLWTTASQEHEGCADR